jgi:hypothetical protein
VKPAIATALVFAVALALLEWQHRRSTDALARSFDAKLATLVRAKRLRPGPPMDPVVARQKAEQVIATIGAKMAAEPRDEPWASDVEHWLAASFSSTFPGTKLDQVLCRQTLCRVDAMHRDDAAMQQWSVRFNAVEKGLPSAVTMPTTEAGGSVRTTTFLAKEGHPFPRGDG